MLLEFYGLLHYAFLSHYSEFSSSKPSKLAYQIFYLYNYLFALKPTQMLAVIEAIIALLAVYIFLFFLILGTMDLKTTKQK